MALSIERVLGWEALDSRGKPTVACLVVLSNGAEGVAVVPSGASTGSHEATERRDGGNRYGGNGVRGAVRAVNDEISPLLRGRDAGDQHAIDEMLRACDGTPSLERLGSNAVLAGSIACAIAAAAGQAIPLWRSLARAGPPLLPMPMVNILSGGAHAGRLVDIQDVLVVPVGASSFVEAIEWASRVRAATAGVLEKLGHRVELVADEGGLAAPLTSNRDAIEVVLAGIERSGLTPGDEAGIAIDVAANQFHERGRYRLSCEQRLLRANDFVAEIRSWCDRFPIVSIEDPLGEDDLDGWLVATKALTGIQLIGDDLFATSPSRLALGVERGIANAILVKPNQIGTLTDARLVLEAARKAGYATVVSARSGETEDAWLGDLAVGWRAGQIKVGSTTRSERTAKWNRILRIEAEHPDAVFSRGLP